MSNEKKSRSEISILIVEDDETTIELLKYLLPKKFNILRFTIVKDGLPAVELCKKEDFDLIFMDIGLPKMDGILAMKKIKSLKPKMVVIAYTAMYKAFCEAESNGFDAAILKPNRIEDFNMVFNKFIL